MNEEILDAAIHDLSDTIVPKLDGEIILVAIYPHKDGGYGIQRVHSEHAFEDCIRYLQTHVERTLAEGA